MLSTNEKKTLSSCSDASKITQLFHKTLLRGQQQISMVQYHNVYLKIIVERHHTVLSADKNLWCMPSSEYYSSCVE